ncbi:MAG: hypothetical protein ACKO4Q_01955, partial [Planctomycetota bacterium]
MSSRADTSKEAFRLLPSIEELLHDARLEAVGASVPRAVWLGFLRALL